MPDTPVHRLPPFEMVTFSEPTGIPFGWDKELVIKGVPKDPLGQYNAAHELTLLEVPDSGPLVCFGNMGFHDHVCQDPHTGAIVYSSDLGEFNIQDLLDDPASVRACMEQDDREVDRVAEDLTEILRSIDIAAVADETTFWRSFVFDVRMGDFATEDVLRDRGQ